MFLCVAVYSCGPVPRTASAPRPCAGDEAPFLLPGAESSPRHFVEVAHSALRSDPLGDTVGEREFSLLLSTEQSTFECSCCLCTGLRSSLAVLNFHETTDISACGGGGGGRGSTHPGPETGRTPEKSSHSIPFFRSISKQHAAARRR